MLFRTKDVGFQGMTLENKLEYKNLFWQSKNILACNFPFHLAMQTLFGMPVPHFGMLFGSWHPAISHPGFTT